MDIKKDQLSGKNNERLYKCNPVNSQYTAAWANVEKVEPVSQVTTPSLEDVIDAKDWVDNGSKL